MEMTGWIMAAAAVTGAAFWILVAFGVAGRLRRGWAPRRGMAAAQARAAERFARGEIDETAYRRLHDDLRPGA